MKKLNVLYVPLVNQDGTNFGTVRTTFPVTEVDLKLLAATLPASNLKDQILAGETSRLRFEQSAPEGWGNNCDVWDQERNKEVASLDEAIKYYFAED